MALSGCDGHHILTQFEIVGRGRQLGRPQCPLSLLPLNDFKTWSRSAIGSRLPSFARAITRLATTNTAGSLRSTRRRAFSEASNANTKASTSSGPNAPGSDSKRGRIGTEQLDNPALAM